MSDQQQPTLEWHRQLAAQTFNSVWEILDQPQRSDYDVIRMIHMAHASVYHWSYVGEAIRMARGEWQVSRVYSVAGMAQSALYHAKISLAICQGSGIGGLDLAFALEAVARALSLEGKQAEARQYILEAREAAREIPGDEDRTCFLSELDTI